MEALGGLRLGKKKKHREGGIRILAGKYFIRETIGSGTTAKVKRGRVISSTSSRCQRKEVAIKIFKPSLLQEQESFRNEMEILKVLSTPVNRHPNILRLVEVLDNVDMYSKHGVALSGYEKRKITALVTEYVDGGELYTYLSSGIVLDRILVRAIFQQLVRAILHLHTNGIVHLDVKPENILLGRSGIVVLSDFGSSQFVKRPKVRKPKAPRSGNRTPPALLQSNVQAHLRIPKSRSMTSLQSAQQPWRQRRLSQIIESRPLIVTSEEGTLEYRAPEVKTNQRYDGAAADIWSLGVVLYVMLYNRLPEKENIETSRGGGSGAELAAELLSHMLRLNPRERFSSKIIANHDWVLASQIRGSTKIVAAGVNKLSIYVEDARRRAQPKKKVQMEMPKSSSLTSLASLASKDSDIGSISSV